MSRRGVKHDRELRGLLIGVNDSQSSRASKTVYLVKEVTTT